MYSVWNNPIITITIITTDIVVGIGTIVFVNVIIIIYIILLVKHNIDLLCVYYKSLTQLDVPINHYRGWRGERLPGTFDTAYLRKHHRAGQES